MELQPDNPFGSLEMHLFPHAERAVAWLTRQVLHEPTIPEINDFEASPHVVSTPEEA